MATDEGAHLVVRVTPNSKVPGIEVDARENVKVRISSKPLQGKANKELLKTLKKKLGQQVRLIAGEKSREKTVFVEGQSKSAALQKLRD